MYPYNKTNEMHYFLKFIFGIDLYIVSVRFSVVLFGYTPPATQLNQFHPVPASKQSA